MPEKAITLVEVLLVVVIIGILATLGIVNYTATKETALKREATSNLQLISAAEKIYKMEISNAYASCQCLCGGTAATCCDNSANGCNYLLKLNLVTQNWTYWVNAAGSGTGATFTATANRVSGPNAGETVTLNQDDQWGGSFTP